MKEIVGARIGTTITNNRAVIANALDRGMITEWIDRPRMQFIASMDLGTNWEMMATGPTLFLLDDKGNPHSATKSPDMAKDNG